MSYAPSPITRTALVVPLLACALVGCSGDKDAAGDAAVRFVQGTYVQQCELTHPDRGGAATNCDSRKNESVWPGHPTEITATEEWKGGYAVTIPDSTGAQDVFGMLKDGEQWKVANFDTVDAQDAATDNPACHALSEDDGKDC
ncbi:hypothetical protein KocCE7_12785 (plasmid) [Kocuria marina subsp. indica]|uniref:hypothetical protein n=1 Tax=Kocuria marina TaxID=223184 RepID=UPI00103C92BA|nr:hypothetical protein [Kocuria indica]QBJ22770.1 hypothetical protein KocCE7_12785 [Kocuria indica]